MLFDRNRQTKIILFNDEWVIIFKGGNAMQVFFALSVFFCVSLFFHLLSWKMHVQRLAQLCIFFAQSIYKLHLLCSISEKDLSLAQCCIFLHYCHCHFLYQKTSIIHIWFIIWKYAHIFRTFVFRFHFSLRTKLFICMLNIY